MEWFRGLEIIKFEFFRLQQTLSLNSRLGHAGLGDACSSGNRDRSGCSRNLGPPTFFKDTGSRYVRSAQATWMEKLYIKKQDQNSMTQTNSKLCTGRKCRTGVSSTSDPISSGASAPSGVCSFSLVVPRDKRAVEIQPYEISAFENEAHSKQLCLPKTI